MTMTVTSRIARIARVAIRGCRHRGGRQRGAAVDLRIATPRVTTADTSAAVAAVCEPCQLRYPCISLSLQLAQCVAYLPCIQVQWDLLLIIIIIVLICALLLIAVLGLQFVVVQMIS